ncbi:MAG: 3-dehydroquinate synthase [Arenimonas sp.]
MGTRAYAVQVGNGLLDSPRLAALVPGKQAFVLSDANVAPLDLERLRGALAGKEVHALVIPAGEQEKSLLRFGEIMQALAAAGASRDVTVLALGGGVVGDLAGFAAACWMRGVRFVQLPTTLLAMVDSSVGGKTAVDLAQGKNLVGAFHQPAAVLADIGTLATLPLRELCAGLAEVVKAAAIADPAFFDWLEANAAGLLAGDEATLEHAIATSVAFKDGVVERDETERGERMLLNFGHSFGHAIETEQGYGGLLHGEAVAVGMLLAARLSTALGLAPAADATRLQALLARLGLPVALPKGLGAEALLQRMRLDKKALSGALRLVLWRGIGRAEVVAEVLEAALRRVLGG